MYTKETTTSRLERARALREKARNNVVSATRGLIEEERKLNLILNDIVTVQDETDDLLNQFQSNI